MSRDVYVYWKDDVKPSLAEVRMTLEDYVKGIGVVAENDALLCTNDELLRVDLPGNASWPLARIFPESNRAKAQAEDPIQRWFEVFVMDDHLAVVVRHGDDITHAIAFGYARMISIYWKAEYKE